MKGTGAKGTSEKKARKKHGLVLDQKFTDRSELRQRVHGEVQIMAARKPSKKFICMSFISKCVGHKTNWCERDWEWWLPLFYPDLHFSDLLSAFVFQNECLKLCLSSEVTPSHRNVSWEVSLRLALSHKGTTYAAACEKALEIQGNLWQICSLTTFQNGKWYVADREIHQESKHVTVCHLPLSINADISVVAVQWLHALGTDTGVHPAWEQSISTATR